MNSTTEVNHEKLMELFGNVFNDVAGSMAIMMSYLGDQTGAYRAMDKLGPATAEEIAKESNVDERYLLEWLSMGLLQHRLGGGLPLAFARLGGSLCR